LISQYEKLSYRYPYSVWGFDISTTRTALGLARPGPEAAHAGCNKTRT
jgi:hypothetical protein